MLMHLFFAASPQKIYRYTLIEKVLNGKTIDRMCGRPYREKCL